MTSLAGLQISPTEAGGPGLPQDPLVSSIAVGDPPRLTVAPNIERWFNDLTYRGDGVLYEDVQIQIGVKSRYQGHLGQVAIYIGNKVSASLTSFTTTIHVENPDALSVTFAKLPPTTITARSQTQQLLHIDCKKMFTTPPILTVSFLAGSHQTIAIRLPIVITKFFESVKLGQTEFFERWKLIGGPPREAQRVFPIQLDGTGQLNLRKHREVVTGHHLGVLEDIDPNPNNIVAAGVLHMSTDGKVGCLLRLEPNREAKVCTLVVCGCACADDIVTALPIDCEEYVRRNRTRSRRIDV
jgi:AP-2 complex subunit alpha